MAVRDAVAFACYCAGDFEVSRFELCFRAACPESLASARNAAWLVYIR